jgi:hypothetical protein
MPAPTAVNQWGSATLAQRIAQQEMADRRGIAYTIVYRPDKTPGAPKPIVRGKEKCK